MEAIRPMLSREAVVLSIFCCWCALGAVARAEDRRKDPSGYSDAVQQGLAELEAGNYPEAREELLRAHGLFPNARTLRGLGMVEFELRNYVACVSYLEEALASSVKPLDQNLRADARSLLERARRYLGELALEVEPHNAHVSIDGKRIEPEQRRTLLLDVGSHMLVVQAPGYVTDKRSIRVQGGQRSELRVELTLPEPEEPVQVVKPPKLALDPAAPRFERTPAYKKWWVWTTVIVVAAAGATTAAILLTRDAESATRPVSGSNPMGPPLYTLRGF
jgi:hypothetical protein